MINKIINKIVFITGSGKNVGKTTFLNYLLPHLRNKNGSLSYLTIGIDGEQHDMIFGTPKPDIHTEADDYIVTCDSAILASDAVFEIVEVFPFSNKLGKLLLVKTLRAGSVELIGPENNTQLNYILNYLRKEKKINTILVDGAVNRITQITSAQNSEFIYVMKISNKDVMTTINQIKTLSLVKNFSIISSEENSSEDVFECTGALTSIKVSKIPENKTKILINDFTKIFLSWNELSDLLKSKTIYYKERYVLLFITVNLIDISKNEFANILKTNNISENIIYNPYQLNRYTEND